MHLLNWVLELSQVLGDPGVLGLGGGIGGEISPGIDGSHQLPVGEEGDQEIHTDVRDQESQEVLGDLGVEIDLRKLKKGRF